MEAGLPIMTAASTFLWFVALLFIAVFIKTVATAYYNVYHHPLSSFPGPKFAAATPIPFVLRVISGHLFDWTLSLHTQYGEIVRINPDELSFAKPSAWQDIYAARPQLPKPTLGVIETPNKVKSINTTASPEDHDRMRKILNHAFSDRALREQEYILHIYTNLLITRLQDQIKKAGVGFTQVDIGDWYNFTTFDITGDLCFGESFHSLENSEHHEWVKSIFIGLKFGTILTIFDYFRPLKDLMKWILPIVLSRKARSHFDWSRERIDKRIQAKSDRPDFMTHILRNNDEKGITRDEIDSTVALLILAGSDTSATTSCSSTWFLLKNPAVMTRLQKEIRTAFKKVEDITIASVAKLPYLHAVILEAMRLHPLGPVNVPREVDREGTIICGYEIPVGTRVGIPVKAANRLPQYFVEPLSFLPERWLEDTDQKFALDKKEMFEPFMVGPRGCIGKRLGWAQMNLILAKMIWSFDLELMSDNKEDWDDQKIWILHERVPLNVKISPRF